MIAARTIGGPAYPEMIEEIDRELTKVIEEFDRAMNYETLRLANETSELSFSQSVDSCCSGVWRRASRARARASRARESRARANRARARAFIQASHACQDRLSPQPPLYGQHPPISSQSNHGLGSR